MQSTYLPFILIKIVIYTKTLNFVVSFWFLSSASHLETGKSSLIEIEVKD